MASPPAAPPPARASPKKKRKKTPQAIQSPFAATERPAAKPWGARRSMAKPKKDPVLGVALSAPDEPTEPVARPASTRGRPRKAEPRAGASEAPEPEGAAPREAPSPRSATAAKLQAATRGRAARKEHGARRDSATKLQASFRGLKGRRAADDRRADGDDASEDPYTFAAWIRLFLPNRGGAAAAGRGYSAETRRGDGCHSLEETRRADESKANG